MVCLPCNTLLPMEKKCKSNSIRAGTIDILSLSLSHATERPFLPTRNSVISKTLTRTSGALGESSQDAGRAHDVGVPSVRPTAAKIIIIMEPWSSASASSVFRLVWHCTVELSKCLHTTHSRKLR